MVFLGNLSAGLTVQAIDSAGTGTAGFSRIRYQTVCIRKRALYTVSTYNVEKMPKTTFYKMSEQNDENEDTSRSANQVNSFNTLVHI